MIPAQLLMVERPYVPTVQTFNPTAVLTTFTHTGGGAAEANLYDGNDSTNAADPNGVTAATAAAYDLGSAQNVNNVRVKVADSFGFSVADVFKIQYSDTGLSSGWTDSGSTISIPAGTGAIVNASVSSGSHRYWRILYQSGGTLGNGWLGELSFQNVN